ncbi:cobaltochelatase subunit CobN [Taklimakanibacter albus]|uniref:Cobaltochelatase subunit CobN n=1 Tax=Taklimakanibacter albus TaxID=2800327 RepID=A0ACC5R1Z6_9HYPH|nr:cobaltochelatase subunit CobN [Aestuariivirga sp. YIM B02566]MBK1866667.1 cobaltochelatase subunit CobN [Aestuariivirga sp. YIM B02566]
MHLLAAQTGVIDGAAEAIDLAQAPGDIVVLSAADSELASLARAWEAVAPSGTTLRLANLLTLQHNLSVDLYLEKTLRHARLIVLRLLGGARYWPYGLAEIEALARHNGIKLAVLPGDAHPDPALNDHSTLSPAECERLRQYLVSGGELNAQGFLRLCLNLLERGEAPSPATALAKAGLYKNNQIGDAPMAAIVFYRSVLEGAQTAPVDALISALKARGIDSLALYVTSLKDAASAQFIAETFDATPPDIILNATAFAVSSGSSAIDTPFTPYDCPVLQVVFAGSGEASWRDSAQGLSARDLAMNVVLPELDGRVFTRAVSFKADDHWDERTQCRIVTYRPVPDRVAFAADLAAAWVGLRRTQPSDRRVAIILANYPNKDGRIANGVGYDTPASSIAILRALMDASYDVGDIPSDGNGLIEALQRGRTNAHRHDSATTLAVADYRRHFAALPADVQSAITERWGTPERDPFFAGDAFALPVLVYGNVAVAIQPARGYNIDPKATYHDPALVPPHGYLAAYFWLRHHFGVQAIIHNGKHGNLEWLPGKATALSASCYPEIAFGPMPHLYPFIVNDPGEGTQAKRRSAAVIIDHLTPPLTRAETYGPLKDLEALVDEYYLASGLDQRRLAALKRDILDLTRSQRLDVDAGFTGNENSDLQKLDAYLCDLKEAQIRDGLHILGASPEGRLETDLLVALTRVPRGLGEEADQSLIRALAGDLGFTDFDPLTCDMGLAWAGPHPPALAAISNDPWRSQGDTVERLELLAARCVESRAGIGPQSDKVIAEITRSIAPRLRSSGENEMAAVLKGLDGRFVKPGPSGAPTRGRLDVLPTGRNFYSLDNRTVPTPTAWTLGQKSAEDLLARHFQDFGRYPKALGLSAWGTSNMRTGGDDIAQALALIGVKPVWEPSSWRVTGYEIIPLPRLGRPRIDVTLRISGFFRDAFPAQIELLDKAIRAVGQLDEPEDDNPIAARMHGEARTLEANGVAAADASHVAGYRIFGSKPGAYGAGLQALIDERLWAERGDLARAYITWGAYAYGARDEGANDERAFSERLKRIEAVVHNQDNREHDLLDSDDYYQFEGGMSAAVEEMSGTRPRVYHNDHSRPERPVIRTLEEEVGRVVRSRVVNPKWINGVKRHGYKGAFEIAATVDYMFAFAATTGAVASHHFDLAYDAFLGDEATRDFIARNNPAALKEIAERLEEAIARGLWTPRSNSAYAQLKLFKEGHLP